jgi:Cof subfamily protein (haloacid dehalogenase superfamily)
MTVRLLAFDYDGTAAIDGQLPSGRVRAAVDAARAQGVHVVLATGRPFPSARRYAEALGLTEPVICFQGAMVRELAGAQQTLFCEPVPPGPMHEVLAMAEERRLDLNVYGDDEFYYVDRGRPTSFYDRWFGMPMRKVSRLSEACDILAAKGKQPLKGLFIGDPDGNTCLTAELSERFRSRLTVVRSHSLFVEVSSLQACKGQALAFLANHLGIDRSETMAVGDGGNDISMIEWAGVGVAMANALDDVRRVACWVAPPVTDDGMAVAIEKFVVNGR